MSETETGVRIESFELGPYATNCYVVSAGESCWIVDAGFDPGRMIERVKESGKTPERLILTHAHADHIAGLDHVRQAFPGLEVWLHPNEHDWLADPQLNLSCALGMPYTTDPAEHSIQGGETLELGGTTWRVFHTPGHSPGSVTLYCKGAGKAIVGDTLFAGSIGRSDFPTSDERALHDSIRNTLYALPDETVVLPGHGPSTTIGREKASNPFVRAS